MPVLAETLLPPRAEGQERSGIPHDRASRSWSASPRLPRRGEGRLLVLEDLTDLRPELMRRFQAAVLADYRTYMGRRTRLLRSLDLLVDDAVELSYLDLHLDPIDAEPNRVSV